MSNRYSQYTWGQYNPLTMQELSLAPVAMRTQHDAAIAKAEASRLQLDPFEKDTIRAQELKNQMDAKIASQVDLLNKEGFNPNTTAEMTKLNREYQDLVGPMGEVSKINAVKPNIELAKKRFLESDDAKSNSAEINQRRWDEHLAKYNGYVQDKKNIDDLSAVKYIDPTAYVDQLATHVGFTDNSWKTANSGLVDTGEPGKNRYVVNETQARKSGTNIEQLKNLAKSLNSTLLDQSSPLRKSIDYTYRNPNEVLRQMNEQLGIYRKNENATESSREITNMNFGDNNSNSTKPGTSLFGEDYNTTEVSGKTANFDQLANIGGDGNVHPFIPGSEQPTRIEDVSNPRQKAVYENAWKQATSGNGIILDGKKVHLNPALIKKGKNNPIVAKQLLRSIRQSKAITLSSKLLTTNQILNNQGFVSGLGATADDVDKSIQRQLERSDNEGRKLIDPKTGKTMNWNDAVKEYGFTDIKDVHYQGQISAHNWEENENLGTNTKFSPHVVTIQGDDKKWYSFKTTRLRSDNVGGNVDRQNDLTTNYRNATLAAASGDNSFQNFESNSKTLKNIKIKYNPSETEVDEYSGEPKSWTIKFENGVPEKVTESDYMNIINSVK